MKTAKELLMFYLENINNADEVIKIFADDASIELPYLASLGLPWRWSGKDTLHQFLLNLPKTFTGFRFQDIQIHMDTPTQAFGEYRVACIAAATGRPYRQHYMGRLEAENGKIKLIREALDMAQVVKSLFPNGIQDTQIK